MVQTASGMQSVRDRMTHTRVIEIPTQVKYVRKASTALRARSGAARD
jgi:hypothetical protein